MAHLAEGLRRCRVGHVRAADRLLARLQAAAATADAEQLVSACILQSPGFPAISVLCCPNVGVSSIIQEQTFPCLRRDAAGRVGPRFTIDKAVCAGPAGGV